MRQSPAYTFRVVRLKYEAGWPATPDDPSKPHSKVLPERGVAQIRYESKPGRVTVYDGNKH
ncbi:hypothetical protein Nm8I071_23190 [Nonomuraea sp. TT08I-71]|nr:hypothetical protein Nm8I071_23190 [Nonomuraea sp. TT08I-71]